MAHICAKWVLGPNPLLTMLGRRGRGEVVEALRDHHGPWTLRGLAARAGVPHQVVGRAVRELEALGAVEFVRPGREGRVQWRPGTPASAFLDGLVVPDLRDAAARTFAAAVPGLPTLCWTRTDSEAADPLAPTRVAVVHEDADAALEQATVGLDAVLGRALPRVDVSAITPEALASDDPIAARMRAGLAGSL